MRRLPHRHPRRHLLSRSDQRKIQPHHSVRAGPSAVRQAKRPGHHMGARDHLPRPDQEATAQHLPFRAEHPDNPRLKHDRHETATAP